MGLEGFWIRPSFKDPFLSRRAKPYLTIRNFFIAVRLPVTATAHSHLVRSAGGRGGRGAAARGGLSDGSRPHTPAARAAHASTPPQAPTAPAKCSRCGKPGHLADACPTPYHAIHQAQHGGAAPAPPREPAARLCLCCGKPGHAENARGLCANLPFLGGFSNAL
jgi:hypothetical protein